MFSYLARPLLLVLLLLLNLVPAAAKAAESPYFGGGHAATFTAGLEKQLGGPVEAVWIIFYESYAVAMVQDPKNEARILELEERDGKWQNPRPADEKYVPKPVETMRFRPSDFAPATIPSLVNEARVKLGPGKLLSVSVKRDHNDPARPLRITVSLLTDAGDLGTLVADPAGQVLTVGKE